MRIKSKAIGKLCVPNIGIFDNLNYGDIVEIQDKMALHPQFQELSKKGLIEIVGGNHVPKDKETHIHQIFKVDVAKEVEKGVTQALTKLFETGVIQLTNKNEVKSNNILKESIPIKKEVFEFKEETYLPKIQISENVKGNIAVNENSSNSEDIDKASEKLKNLLKGDRNGC